MGRLLSRRPVPDQVGPTQPSTAATGSADVELDKLFPFPLDAFQLEAIDALNQGHSVVVSAPTG
jgi:superfamily II RNA helicase